MKDPKNDTPSIDTEAVIDKPDKKKDKIFSKTEKAFSEAITQPMSALTETAHTKNDKGRKP